jgi:hypothetical protein
MENQMNENQDNKKEMSKVYNKRYYDNHKEKWLKHSLEKIDCVCGVKVARGNLSKHIKTEKHKLRHQIKLNNNSQ